MRVFVLGGTGLVGSRLLRRLLERKDEVVLLTRRPDAARAKWGSQCTIVQGDPMVPGPWQAEVNSCDGVINLVGEGIFNQRWSEKFKALLRDSRIQSTHNLAETLQKAPGRVKVLVNASAIGYYGPHGAEELDETAPAGTDFLAQLCVNWEKATQPAESAGVRVILLRVGVVLDREGGALKQMLTPFKMFVGGPIGSGQQYVSWIHHEDLVGLILLGLDNAETAGPLNGTAPQPLTNRDFSKALGQALGRPSFMPTPTFGIRLLLGEVADVVAKGQRVLPRKAQLLGYNFRFPEIGAALRDALQA